MTNSKRMENRRPAMSKKNYLITLTHQELEDIVLNVLCKTLERLKAKETNDVYLTRRQTAEILKVSLPTLHTWSQKGLLKSHKINSRVRYIKSEVEKFIQES